MSKVIVHNTSRHFETFTTAFAGLPYAVLCEERSDEAVSAK
jgi:hypothetical protein